MSPVAHKLRSVLRPGVPSARKVSPFTHARSELWEREDIVQDFERQKARIAKKIRLLRHERKLTQETAAEQIGVHPKQLQRLESATKNVTLINLVAVAKAYKVTLKELFE